MAIVADFMLVWLPAPTVSLQPPLSVGAGLIAKFFRNCPDNAFQVCIVLVEVDSSPILLLLLFSYGANYLQLMQSLLQVALAGRSYSLLQRIGAIVVMYHAFMHLVAVTMVNLTLTADYYHY